ncbi:MAG: zinc ribbon domain-containing protein [Thermodesulforhabdaceae bacterium]
MPIFEYQCGTCGHRFETLVLKTSEGKDEIVTCPACGDSNCVRLISLCFSARSGSTITSPGVSCGTTKSGIG